MRLCAARAECARAERVTQEASGPEVPAPLHSATGADHIMHSPPGRISRVRRTDCRYSPSPAAAVRTFSLRYIGAVDGRGAGDCGSPPGPARPAPVFLGTLMPRSLRGTTYPGEQTPTPGRCPSRTRIHGQCRQSQPRGSTDWRAVGCALYPYRSRDGPGKAPRRGASQGQHEAAAGATAHQWA